MGEYGGFGYLYWLRWKPNTCNVKSLSVSFQWKSWAVITQVASLQPRLCLLDSSLHSREVKGMDSRALEKLVLTCHGACWGGARRQWALESNCSACPSGCPSWLKWLRADSFSVTQFPRPKMEIITEPFSWNPCQD